MSYDLHGAWQGENNVTGCATNFDDTVGTGNSIQSAVDYVAHGKIPDHKLTVGLTFNGNTYNLSSVGMGLSGSHFSGGGKAGFCPGDSEGYLPFNEILYQLTVYDIEPSFDSKAVCDYAVMFGNQLVAFDDPETISFKANWVQRQGYGGVFAWAPYSDTARWDMCYAMAGQIPPGSQILTMVPHGGATFVTAANPVTSASAYSYANFTLASDLPLKVNFSAIPLQYQPGELNEIWNPTRLNSNATSTLMSGNSSTISYNSFADDALSNATDLEIIAFATSNSARSTTTDNFLLYASRSTSIHLVPSVNSAAVSVRLSQRRNFLWNALFVVLAGVQLLFSLFLFIVYTGPVALIFWIKDTVEEALKWAGFVYCLYTE